MIQEYFTLTKKSGEYRCIICGRYFDKNDAENGAVFYSNRNKICLCWECVNVAGSVVKYFDTESEIKRNGE